LNGKEINMNAMEFTNVVISEKLQRERGIPKADYKLYSNMNVVVEKLAPLHPMWRFEITEANNFATLHPEVLKVQVSEYGEVLGTIARHWHGQEYHMFITNDRINANMLRGSAYKTTSPEKAIAKIKKTFSRPNVNERVTKALHRAETFLLNQVNLKGREERESKHPIRNEAMTYIMGKGWPLFLEHVETLPTNERDKILKNLQDRDRLKDEMLTIESVQSKFTDKKTALVIKDAGKYVVKIGDTVQIYDDNSLPADLRGGIGLLKLVDVEHFLTDIGCRVNEEVFVVLVKEEGEEHA
jgi:hypothetical protein